MGAAAFKKFSVKPHRQHNIKKKSICRHLEFLKKESCSHNSMVSIVLKQFSVLIKLCADKHFGGMLSILAHHFTDHPILHMDDTQI